jgi:uncharacterized repeat protein (TIGR01451 family)
MKAKTLILSTATALIVPVASLAGPAFADSPGQIENGNIYRIQNVTQNVNFANPASANACDELEYSVQLHNPGYDQISNIVTTATLPSGSATSNTSKMNIVYSDGIDSGINASAILNLTTSQSVTYVSGSTELLDVNGKLIETLPDGITTGSGVNVGGLAGSTTEYVNFEVKVSCPAPVTPPVTPTPAPTPTTPAPTAVAPTQLVNTGAGNVIGLFAAVTAVSAFAYRYLVSRRLSRQ